MIITINKEKIPDNIYEQELDRARANNPGIAENEIKELAVQNIVDWTIIRQEANKKIRNVSVVDIEKAFTDLVKSHGGVEQFHTKFNLSSKDNIRVKKDLERNIKTQRFLNELVKDVPNPTAQEIQEYYEKNKEKFVKPAQIHAAHIVKQINPANPGKTFNELLELRQKLLNGESFANVANKHSSCQDEGGDLGFFSRGKMVEEFETVVFSMNVGEISPIFQTQFGYHIAMVYEKKGPEYKTLGEAKAEIEENLKTEWGDDLIGQWVDSQKKKAEITVKES
ncbi:peptidylprolyl isomerase [candidate division KSB1 bacterium]|nr:peptidylprolyl isomerase [candidate division KSB1 bacterium]